MSEIKTFPSSDGKSTISYEIWAPEEKPVAILQLVHGMSEYVHRYEELALYLNKQGILVTGEDHIGHGHSADYADYGYFGPENGWQHMVEDVETLRSITAEAYPGVPYIMMGHSMGSFITRAWMAKYGSSVDGTILMGTAGKNPAIGFGIFLAKLIKKLKGERHKSRLLTIMAFGSYSKRIPDAKTHSDWLTRDQAVVNAYVEDSMCGFIFKTAGYIDLFEMLKYINTEEWYTAIPKELPVLVIAGKEEPVGEYGNGPTEVAEGLIAAGCSKTQLSLYDDMRHEILNEFGKEEVFEELNDYILACAGK